MTNKIFSIKLLLILLYIPQGSLATDTKGQNLHISTDNHVEQTRLSANAQIETPAHQTASSLKNHATSSQVIRDIKFPSSMASDGRFYYISSTPPQHTNNTQIQSTIKAPRNYTKIAKFKRDGTVIDEHFAPRGELLKSVGGMVIIGHNIYASDTNRLLAMNVQTGKFRFAISFAAEGTQSLAGIAKKNEHELFVTSSDTGQVFHVNLQKKTYIPLRLSHKLRQPKGLAYDQTNDELFVTEFGKTNAKGRLLKIKPHLYQISTVHVLGNNPSFRGNFDAVYKVDNQLFVSDWHEGSHSGKIHQFDLNNNTHTTLPMRSLRGPSDLLLDTTSEHWWISATLDHLIIITPAETLPPQNIGARKIADK